MHVFYDSKGGKQEKITSIRFIGKTDNIYRKQKPTARKYNKKMTTKRHSTAQKHLLFSKIAYKS